MKHKILCGDCIDVMKEFEADSIDLVVTSPPYDNLREYNGYSFTFENTAKELFRIIKEGGVVVWVAGDATINGSETGTSFRQALFFKEIGFNLHDTMIYQKNGSAYPANVKSNRYSQIFEYMFIFSKEKPKTVNLIRDKKNNWAGFGTFGQNSERRKNGKIKRRGKFIVPEYSYRNNIWLINNGFGYSSKDEKAYQHPAIFPEALAGDHILSWSSKSDIILDPMCGSGTTLIVAERLGRDSIGVEISKEYCELAFQRLKNEVEQTKLGKEHSEIQKVGF